MAVLGTVAVVSSGIAGADGTETLGAPVGVSVATGTGIAVGGVGLGGMTIFNGTTGTGVPNQSGTFNVSVPAGATVKQVLLYWEGHFSQGSAPDNTITLNGNAVTGGLIGGPTLFFADVYAAAFRANVTGLGLVGAGTTSLTVAGLDNSFANNGAGVVVIYDAGGTQASIALRDGLDLAYAGFSPTLDTTVPQTFTFAPATTARTASLGVMAGSVEANRPNAIRLTSGGVTTTLVNPLSSAQGPEWDAKTIPVNIPAGATSLTVQALSQTDGSAQQPASFSWIVGALSVPGTTAPPGSGAGTPGFWKNRPEAWPVSTLSVGGVTYTKAQLLIILGESKSRDLSYQMASQLVAAKLNVASGANATCITSTISAADAWLAANPVGSGVTGDSAAWAVGNPIKNQLDAYNNGLLCAPSRDS